MHEMQTVVTDDRGVCPSVCHEVLLGFTVQKWLTDQDAVWGEHSWGPWNIVLDGGHYPPTPTGRGAGEHFANYGPTTYHKNG